MIEFMVAAALAIGIMLVYVNVKDCWHVWTKWRTLHDIHLCEKEHDRHLGGRFFCSRVFHVEQRQCVKCLKTQERGKYKQRFITL